MEYTRPYGSIPSTENKVKTQKANQAEVVGKSLFEANLGYIEFQASQGDTEI